MKTISQSPVITPAIIGLVICAVLVVLAGLSEKKIPLLSNIRLDILLLVGIGMAICTQGGIGRVAAAGLWSHPLAILGYILGALILFITLSVFVGWKLPFVQTDQQALLAIAILASAKIVNALVHSWIS